MRTLAVAMIAVPLMLGGTHSAQAAGPKARRLGDHPAVVVQRLHKAAGYDYAAKFYPHPAWLWLRPAPEVPEDLAGARERPADHPAAPAPAAAAPQS